MIFSISGWRTVISQSEHPFDVTDYHLTTIYYGIRSYLEMKQKSLHKSKIHICIGCDSRISGILLLELAKICVEEGGHTCDNLGMIPIPALLSYAKQYTDGLIYFSASHNPKEYNGVKYGSGEGKIQGQDDNNAMMSLFHNYVASSPGIAPQTTNLMRQIASLPTSMTTLSTHTQAYATAQATYKKLIVESVFKGLSASSAPNNAPKNEPEPNNALENEPEKQFRTRLEAYQKKHGHTLGVLLDPNGGARTWQGDTQILNDFGITCTSINTTPSQYNHAIIPEGASLEQARDELLHINREQQDCVYPMAVVCDCDGDRGNTIFISTRDISPNHGDSKTKTLEAQEVFATILNIELAWAKYISKQQGKHTKVAIAINGPSSLRCNRIAKKYHAHVVRGEVGEANIVTCGEELQKQGYHVPLVGEASNGGIIMFPSSVRDPLCTILSIFKAILWAEELELDEDTLTIVNTLPTAYTSTTEDPLAKFSLPNLPYEKIGTTILTNFSHHKQDFIALFEKENIHITDYSFIHFVGSQEKHINKNALDTYTMKSGGLAIHFFKDNEKDPCAFVWLRPSGTEPVVRLMVDVLEASHELLVSLQKQWRAYLHAVLFSHGE